MCSLHGDARVQFEYLMDTVASRNETIENLNDHLEDGKRRFNLLEQELFDEKDNSSILAQQIETYEIDCVKNKDTIARSLELSQQLDASKKELEVAHASLTKEFEHLEKANKLIKGELIVLKEKHAQLQATYEKSLGTSSDPINVENIACASNSLIDQAILVEEIEKLKVQLEKERLDKVLAHQKVRPFRQGLGYVAKEATPPKRTKVQDAPKVDGTVKKKVVNGGATRGNPNHMFAGKTNPSYVLCKGNQGDVYAKYVGPRNGYAYRGYSIWVPKSLVTNAKGPIAKWVPKQKT
jgi:vacuolar-type H+-ATPase subunit D/Vma8